MEQGGILIRLRKEKGLSQAEVAEELGVTRQAVSRWESGRAWPSAEKLVAVSRLYGVTVEELCWEKPVLPASDEPEEDHPEADSLGENTPHKKHIPGKKKLVLLTVLMLTYVLVYAAGILTRSENMAIVTLIGITFLIALVWTIHALQKNTKRKDLEK